MHAQHVMLVFRSELERVCVGGLTSEYKPCALHVAELSLQEVTCELPAWGPATQLAQ
jgi:hypothetical protein